MFRWIPRIQYLDANNQGMVGCQQIQILQQSQISKALRTVLWIQNVGYPGNKLNVRFSGKFCTKELRKGKERRKTDEMQIWREACVSVSEERVI